MLENLQAIFGLINALSYFSEHMYQTICPLVNKIMMFYVDIVIPAKQWEHLIIRLRIIS